MDHARAASPVASVAKRTHSETGEGGSRRMIESRPSIFGTHDGTECYDRPPPRTLLVPKVPKLQPAHQANEADPQTYAGSDESPDIGAVQRLYPRLAQIIQEHHRSQQRQH